MRRFAVVAVALLLNIASDPVLAQASQGTPPAAAPFSSVKAEPKAEFARPAQAKATTAAESKASAAPGDPKPSEPKKASKSPSAVKLEPNQKLCRSKLPSGGVKSWTCEKDQPCCVNHTSSTYTCGSQLLKCF